MDEAVASTFGWDTVYGVNVAMINQALSQRGVTPDTFDGVFKGPLSGIDVKVSGTFGPWAVTGGSGTLVHMTLPVIDGNVITAGREPVVFAGDAVIEVTLFLTSDSDTAPRRLIISQAHAANVLSFTTVGSQENFDLEINSVLQSWLARSLPAVSFVFATVSDVANPPVSGLSWLMPTSSVYAIVSVQKGEGNPVSLAVLSQTETDTDAGLSPQVAPGLVPVGDTVGYGIKPQLFVRNALLPGMPVLFAGGRETDFELTNQGLTISNTSALTLQTLVVDSDHTISDMTVAPGKFAIVMEANAIRVEAFDMTFEWQSGIIVTVTLRGRFKISMDTDRRLVFSLAEIPEADVMISKTSSERWKEIGEEIGIGIAIAVLGAVLGGVTKAIVGGLSKAATTIMVGIFKDDPSGDISFSSSDIEIDSSRIPTDFSTVQTAAANDIANLGVANYTTPVEHMLGRMMQKVFGAAVAGLTGKAQAEVVDILKAYGAQTTAEVPSIDVLLKTPDAAIKFAGSPSSSPTVTGFSIEEGAILVNGTAP